MLKSLKRSPRFRFFNPQQPLFIAHWNNRSTIGQFSRVIWSIFQFFCLLLEENHWKKRHIRSKLHFDPQTLTNRSAISSPSPFSASSKQVRHPVGCLNNSQSSALLLPLLLPKSRHKPASSRTNTYFPSTSETDLHIPSQQPSALSTRTLFKNPDA